MKPYTRDATCPKCNTTWQAHRAKITYQAAERQMSTTEKVEGHKLVTTHHAPWLTVPEHLHCACENCGYEWLMECADAERAKDGPPDNIQGREIICPACHGILLVISDHEQIVHLETYARGLTILGKGENACG